MPVGIAGSDGGHVTDQSAERAESNPGRPAVSIGVPVYNGEKSLRSALDSLLAQTFTDFELIISDNASTDGTAMICHEYVALDSRIRYVRQSANIGSAANFKFVLHEAAADYFMWAACDDRRSPDFVEENHRFLSGNPAYVASTSPSGFDRQGWPIQDLERFSLDGETCERFLCFFEHCWVSHAMFYSLARTSALRACQTIGQSFIAADWAIILELARQGKMYRCEHGWILFGTGGVSNSPNAFKVFRTCPMEILLPLYRISMITIRLADNMSGSSRWRLYKALARENLRAMKIQFIILFHGYLNVIRRILR